MLFLSAEEVATLAEAIHPHFRVLIYVAAYTGLRAGELGALRRSDVDLLRGRLAVNEALRDLSSTRLPEAERGLTFGPTKTHARRTITLPAFLRDLLTEHLMARPPEADALVFTMPNGGPVRQTNFDKRYFKPTVRGRPEVKAQPARNGRRAVSARPAVPGCLPAAKAGIRFHDLRHTCAALLIGAGAHPKTIQERLGHKSITMTLDRYGHLLPGLGDALAAALDAAHTAAQTPPDNVRELRPAARRQRLPPD
jgi:integrase